MADIHAMIAALYAERKRVSQAIVLLEARARAAAERNPQNRGRKSMAAQERMEVSRRMTAYWAARRAERKAGN